MNVILTGLPYFTQKLAKQLNDYSSNIKFIPLDTNSKTADKIKFLFSIITSKALYFQSGGIEGSYTTDLALFLRKKVIMNWAGTDVLKAIENFKNGNYKPKHIDKVHHYCVAPWLQEELKTIGIQAEILPVTVLEKRNDEKSSYPEKFKVLGYVGKGREEFYGINTFIKLANDFKEIEFRIVGIDSFNKPTPSNIEFLGWVKNMDEEYKNCSAYVRDTEHDGMPFTIIEALSYGKPVFFNREFPFVRKFSTYIDLKEQLQIVLDAHSANKLTIDKEAIEFVQKEYSKDKVLDNLIKKIVDAEE